MEWLPILSIFLMFGFMVWLWSYFKKSYLRYLTIALDDSVNLLQDISNILEDISYRLEDIERGKK